MSKLKPIEPETFQEFVQKSDEPYLVLFWGKGCGPCGVVKPIFEKCAEENPSVKFLSLQASVNYKLAGHFKVLAVPTLVKVTKEGYTKMVGPKTEKDIMSMLGNKNESFRDQKEEESVRAA